MTDKHTPGPWWTHWAGIGDYFVAGAGKRELTRSISREDARLIAQAPAMLRALQRLTHPMADDEDVDHAMAVIRAATGQPEPDEDEGPEPPYAGYESEAELRRMAEVRALRAKGQG